MRVTARYYNFFSTVTGKLSEQVDGKGKVTVRDLIERQVRRYGFKFRDLCFIRPIYSEKDYINICINTLDLNDRRKFPDGLDTSLSDGDTVSFGPVGGAA
ncbi:MAG: hypothetical protein FH756_04200 [Firmicutes bacterium]|nr:hypothetical protein [Bacillota bacterium]